MAAATPRMIGKVSVPTHHLIDYMNEIDEGLDLEFFHGLMAVPLDGAQRDSQRLGDLKIPRSRRNEARDLSLTLRQPPKPLVQIAAVRTLTQPLSAHTKGHIQPAQQALRIDRLDEKVQRTVTKGTDCLRHTTRATHEDNRDIVALPEPAQQLEPIDLRQLHITQQTARTRSTRRVRVE